MEKKIYTLDSIEAYNKLIGVETLHPMVTVVDLNKTTHPEVFAGSSEWRYGVYALFLKMGVCGDLTYGHQKYDYSEGTVTSFAPGQVVGVERQDEEPHVPNCYALLFDRDFIHGTSLGRSIGSYHYFDYTSHEALHLSERERETYKECLRKIQEEIERPVDKHSRKLICASIEILLEYCQRFYDRQFIMREDANLAVIARFERELNEYFQKHATYMGGLPTVKYFAERCFLSPNYFGDLVKKETGKTPMDFIQDKVIDIAKEQLRGSDQTIAEIAYHLGFEYTQHFSRYFKKMTGMTPKEYRQPLLG